MANGLLISGGAGGCRTLLRKYSKKLPIIDRWIFMSAYFASNGQKIILDAHSCSIPLQTTVGTWAPSGIAWMTEMMCQATHGRVMGYVLKNERVHPKLQEDAVAIYRSWACHSSTMRNTDSWKISRKKFRACDVGHFNV